ncbi:MAG: alpha/beta fold hydrolase [Gammaproteobacteria bacterium]
MIVWLMSTVFLILAALLALYFLAPGVVFRAAMALARRSAGLTLRQVEVDGHTVPYLEGGAGAPLLLLHGFGANKDNWTMIAPHLTRHFRVIAPDLPGFGDASRLEHASYGLDEQLERIGAFARALGLERFHLAGNSMGGYLAAMYARRHGEQVESLWLLAPAGALGAEPSEALAMMEHGDNPLVAETPADFERLMDLCFCVRPPMPKQFRRPLLERSRAEAPFNHKIFGEIFAEPVGLEGVIDGLETRTLLVWGDQDRILHPSGFDIIKGLLGNVDAVLMKNMGHVPMVERPAETAADYLRFRGVSA